MLHHRTFLHVATALGILLCSACGGGSSFDTPEDPSRPTITVTTKGIVLSGTLTRLGDTDKLLVPDTTKTMVTVSGSDASQLQGERAVIDTATSTWSYVMPTLTESQTVHVRYWVENRLIETEKITITIPAP